MSDIFSPKVSTFAYYDRFKKGPKNHNKEMHWFNRYAIANLAWFLASFSPPEKIVKSVGSFVWNFAPRFCDFSSKMPYYIIFLKCASKLKFIFWHLSRENQIMFIRWNTVDNWRCSFFLRHSIWLIQYVKSFHFILFLRTGP